MEELQPITLLSPMLRVPQLTATQVALRRAMRATLLTYWSWAPPQTSPLPLSDEIPAPLMFAESTLVDSRLRFSFYRRGRRKPRFGELLLNCGILMVIALLLVAMLYFLSR